MTPSASPPREVRAKVIGEGANLGVTQRARIEFGLHGGACNSDAIDNSGGVNSLRRRGQHQDRAGLGDAQGRADPPGAQQAAGRNDRRSRPARAVQQLPADAGALAGAQARPRRHAAPGALHDRRWRRAACSTAAVETLPSPAALAERQARGEPLTRAELGVLLAYAKIVLFSDIARQRRARRSAFRARPARPISPTAWPGNTRAEIDGHRLRREIIARVLANDLVNRGGPAFVSRLQDATGRSAGEVVRAFTVVRDGFALAGALCRHRRAGQQDRWPGAARSLSDRWTADLRRRPRGSSRTTMATRRSARASPNCGRPARSSNRRSDSCCRPS